MDELITLAWRAMAALRGRPAESGSTALDAESRPQQTQSRGCSANGVKWSDIVADIESERV